jgi:heme oxygenase
MRVAQYLEFETRQLHVEVEATLTWVPYDLTVGQYRAYLSRVFGFVNPLELALLDTPGINCLDGRHLRKRLLLMQDLQELGLRPAQIEALPQCMWIPWFEDIHTALGWAYVVELSMRSHPILFRKVAQSIPGEAAFASSFLKAYAGANVEMWRSFVDVLEATVSRHEELVAVADAAKAAGSLLRRWRNLLDGKSLSDPALPVFAKGTRESVPLTRMDPELPGSEGAAIATPAGATPPAAPELALASECDEP